MRTAPLSLSLWFVSFALLVGACGGSDESDSAASDARGAIVGTFSCDYPGGSEPTFYEFKEDRTATAVTLANSGTGTWSGESNEGVITIEGEDGPFTLKDGPFTIESDRLVFTDDPSFRCSRVG
jgi:hypothetical protein